MIKKQTRITLILAAVAIIIVAAYFLLIKPSIETKQEDDAPEIFEGEVLGSANRILIMEHVEKKDMREITVHNSYGEYAFVRGEDDNFYVKGNEGAPFSAESFSSLVVSAGFTLSKQRIMTDCTDFSEFGLAEADDPAWYTITKQDGTTHTVYIGDPTPDGASYYCRYKDRASVYTLDSTISTTLLSDLCVLITPILSYPVGTTDFTTVDNFYIARDGELFVYIDYLTGDEKTANSGRPYKMMFPANYSVNSDNYGTVLSSFQALQGTKTVKIGNTSEVMTKETLLSYGIDPEAAAYELHYTYTGLENTVLFSKPNPETGVYYAYSMLFNLIAEVDPSLVSYLSWEITKFVDKPLFIMSINDVAEIDFSGKDYNETFILSGEGDDLSVTVKSTGKVLTADEVKNFRQFYVVLISFGFDGYAKQTPEELECTLTLTIKTDFGNTSVYKFYPYSTRQALYTIDGKGEFYVKRDDLAKVLSDAAKAAAGTVVDADAKN